VLGEPGLYLFVSGDGQVRRWLFRFTSPQTHRVTEAGLDMASSVSLAQARAKAQDLRRRVAAGIDPIKAKRTERASTVTFGEASTMWIEMNKATWKDGDNGSMMKSATLLLHVHGAPLAKMPVSLITADHIQSALQQLWNRAPNQGRRTLALWERLFDFCKAKGMRTGENPADWKGRHQFGFPKARAGEHFAALPYEQMAAFMRALRQKQMRSAAAFCLEFTILTAARTGEVLGMRWSEIDWEQATWTVPKERMKAAREHAVPLSARCLEVLRRQQQYNGNGEYVFSGYTPGKRLAEAAMKCLLKSMNASVTVHGMRSSFRDWAGDMTHYAREHVEACLAHRVGSATELAYRRQTALEKRREILQAWSRFCAGDAVLASAAVAARAPTAQAAE
jgi:integrase